MQGVGYGSGGRSNKPTEGIRPPRNQNLGCRLTLWQEACLAGPGAMEETQLPVKILQEAGREGKKYPGFSLLSAP